jgi:hypothetical protein
MVPEEDLPSNEAVWRDDFTPNEFEQWAQLPEQDKAIRAANIVVDQDDELYY